MPGKMARSDARPSVRVTRALVAVSTSRLSCKRAGANANIDAGLGFIWRISVKGPSIMCDGAEIFTELPIVMKLKFREDRKMLRAFKLYPGPDHASHVLEGTIDEKDRTDVVAIHFKETPAHSSYDWHPAPEKQFVITLSGTLEFITPDGEKFVVRPGDVLLA